MIYVVLTARDAFTLLDRNAKRAKKNPTNADKNALRRILAALDRGRWSAYWRRRFFQGLRAWSRILYPFAMNQPKNVPRMINPMGATP
ncbi:MAG: hypothetical protein LGL72_11250 [Acidibrevibacterium sp.]|uniref:hypothetical protein n=1 Tax=Acidibrevibacterium fodinaquatile TaxID=1969806 RepID=UPI0023A8681E|nr:hypothetical protein [Acidibrevibacterium fodinaquatile]MCA7119959.1 hypothetical protein [Acidibrevibacterium fodinaquatile]